MIKICFVLSSLSGGGAERFFLHLQKHLSRRKFEISLILFNSCGEYYHLLPKEICIVDLKHSQSDGGLLALILKLKKVLSDVSADLVFSTMGFTNLICLITKAIFRIKSCMVIHEAGVLKDQLSYGSFKLLKKVIYKFFCNFADAIVFPSQAVRENFHEYIRSNSKKYKVIHTPSDFSYINSRLTEDEYFNKLQLKTNKKIIISMGRLEKIKGLDLGIKSFAKLHKDFPCYYWILGQGSQEQRLKKLAEDLRVKDDVIFLGFQDNPFVFLKHADVCLLPSYSETLPYALIEAMYCKCPCVSTQYNSSVSEIIDNGINGIVVKDFDPDQIALALKNLLLSEPQRFEMKQKAHLKAQQFSIEKLIPKYEALFFDLCKNVLEKHSTSGGGNC